MNKEKYPSVPNFVFGQGSSSVVRPLPTKKPDPIPEDLTLAELKELLQKSHLEVK